MVCNILIKRLCLALNFLRLFMFKLYSRPRLHIILKLFERKNRRSSVIGENLSDTTVAIACSISFNVTISDSPLLHPLLDISPPNSAHCLSCTLCIQFVDIVSITSVHHVGVLPLLLTSALGLLSTNHLAHL